MTELTEQWKKGELPCGWYYVKVIPDFEYPNDIAFYTGGYFELYSDEDIEQVLATLPSYEEYLESESHCAVYSEVNESLKEENQQLKELLKEWVQFETEENPNDFTVISERMSELTNKTNQVLGEK